MKRLAIIPALFLCFLFSSCFDVVESYTFKSDGSCKIDYNYDMGEAISVLYNLLPDSVKHLQEFQAHKDTMLNFYSSLTDSTREHLNINDLQMVKSTNLLVKIDLPDNKMVVNVEHEAKTPSGLKYFLQNITRFASNQFNNIIKRKDKNLEDFKEEMMLGQDFYQYVVTPQKFYRTIDTSKFRQYVKENEQMVIMAKALLINMPYKVVIKLPRSAKKIDNHKAVLSADKKEVTIAANLDDAIQNPAVMNFKIDY
jgi:hypothetical protein